jgi:citrate lyase subunit beta/citryl-CoA lyase
MLYLPATNARALEKARTLACDAIIIDLEDSVAPEAKDLARSQAVAAVRAGGFGHREVAIRINALDSPWGAADLAAVSTIVPDAVVIPKVSDPGDVDRVTAGLASTASGTQIWAMVETLIGVMNVRDIAASASRPASRLAVLVVGTNDLAKEARAHIDPERTAALFWLSAILTAGHAYGLDVIDGVYNDFRDPEGCRRECNQGRRLGMDGKSVIHPDQIAVANAAFTPSPAEVAAAEAIVAAFEAPEHRGKGVISIGGRMVELLHRDAARRTLLLAHAIRSRSVG